MEVRPTKPQWEYLTTKALYPALIAGYGSGKTEAAILRSVLGKIKHPTLDRGFYEPTYDLIRMIAFPRFEQTLDSMGVPYRLYKSPLNYIQIQGQGKIFFRSMDAPHRIVGYEHADADVDEIDILKTDDASKAWRQIMARNRQSKPKGEPNTIGCTTTPEGFKFAYNTWKREKRPGYEIIQARTSSNPHLPEGYIQSLKDIYPPEQLAAYLDGEFVNLTTGTVYNAYDRVKHRSSQTVETNEPLYIGMDFNVQNMSAVVYVIRDGNWHAVDELTGCYDTPAMIDAIKTKYSKHTIRIYPDASGASRKSVDASISDIALLEQAGFMVSAHKKNPAIKDRVTSTNQGLLKNRLQINDDKCPEFSRCLEQLAYDKNGMPDKSTGLDHIVDAGTYPIAYEFPTVKPIMFTGINSAR